MMIAVTMLSTYLYCKRMLFLQKVLKLKEPLKESLVLGIVRHEIYDKINKDEEKIVTSIKEDDNINELYKKSYLKKVREIIIKNKAKIREVNLEIVEVFKKTWPYILGEAEERADKINNFIKINKAYGKELWVQLTPKIISELRVESSNLQLRGIIDKIEVYKEDYVPIELKTGNSPKDGMWPGHRIQIAAYILLLEEKYNKKIKEGFIHYLDNKEKRHLAMNPFLKEEIIELISKVKSILEQTYLPKYNKNEKKCANCGLREQCFNEEELNTLIEGKL